MRSLVPRRSRGGGNPLGYEAINSDADVADQVNAWIKFKRAWIKFKRAWMKLLCVYIHAQCVIVGRSAVTISYPNTPTNGGN